MISIDTQRLSSSVESSDRNTEKDDSRCSQQNPFSETSRLVLIHVDDCSKIRFPSLWTNCFYKYDRVSSARILGGKFVN